MHSLSFANTTFNLFYFAKVSIFFGILKNIAYFFLKKIFNMTFKEHYKRAKAMPSPCQMFIKDIAQLTNRSEICVKKWLGGNYNPSKDTQQIIAEYLKEPAENLFPQKKGGSL